MPNPGQSQLNKRSDTLSRLMQSHWKVRLKFCHPSVLEAWSLASVSALNTMLVANWQHETESCWVSAIGCADLDMPFGGWWRRDGPLSASSGCGQSGHLWHWTCSDESRWISDHPVVNCTEAHTSGSSS